MKTKTNKVKRHLGREIYKNRMIYLLISPFFIIYGIFGLFPILYSFFLSFHKWNGTGEMKYVGIAYYQYLLKDSTFLLSIKNPNGAELILHLITKKKSSNGQLQLEIL